MKYIKKHLIFINETYNYETHIKLFLECYTKSYYENNFISKKIPEISEEINMLYYLYSKSLQSCISNSVKKNIFKKNIKKYISNKIIEKWNKDISIYNNIMDNFPYLKNYIYNKQQNNIKITIPIPEKYILSVIYSLIVFHKPKRLKAIEKFNL